MSNTTEYPAERLHAIMAGNGNPYAVLTPLRRQLIRALHDGLTAEELAATFGLSTENATAELAPLVDASLVHQADDTYVPSFFVADADETCAGAKLADHIGRQLAEFLLNRWGEFVETYRRMAIHGDHEFASVSFLLVGDLILDVGLLDALARDGRLMPRAPARPSPGHPDAHYYFWMIDGSHDHLGRYGQRAIDLPWAPWIHVSFGQYWIDGVLNQPRDDHYRNVLRILDEGGADSPEQLARAIRAPVIGKDDSLLWRRTARKTAGGLVGVYRDAEPALRAYFGSTRSANAQTAAFAEFFCWFDHVAYASAIDVLADEGVLRIPESRYITAVLYEDENSDN